MTPDAASTLAAVAMVGLVAVFVFEVIKYDRKRMRRPCICGHRLGQHVQPMDWDSSAYIDGAEFKPWTCRECRCRRYITK